MAKAGAPFPRHQMVRVDPQGWRSALRARPDLAAEPLLMGWADHWPLIARRPACDDGADTVPLGLPLPPDMGKRRLSFRLPAADIIDSQQPPLLNDAAQAAPDHWQESIALLVAFDPMTRCFGSLAWQYLTGLPYLAVTSDLDLLWSVGSATEADVLAVEITAVDWHAPMRIDGELVMPSGIAVQWREWQSASAELVAKSFDGVRLIEREAAFA